MEILHFILAHWVEWLFAAITAFASFGYRQVSVRLKKEQNRTEAIASGIQCLLRDRIVDNYNKYSNRGYCPIFVKESLQKLYRAYHDGLGGNDVASGLYEKLMAMPEDKPEVMTDAE
jgi:hypothetical protein